MGKREKMVAVVTIRVKDWGGAQCFILQCLVSLCPQVTKSNLILIHPVYSLESFQLNSGCVRGVQKVWLLSQLYDLSPGWRLKFHQHSRMKTENLTAIFMNFVIDIRIVHVCEGQGDSLMHACSKY